ncbi:MAG: GAF domain-containing protein [Thermoprotei archaeon]
MDNTEISDKSKHLQEIEMIVKSGAPDILQRVVEYLRDNFSKYSWVGVYLLHDDTLELAAWSGKHATAHVRIPVGMGICGLAAREKKTVIVGDVNSDPRYLQCFTETKSEIVVPIMRGRTVYGEIDIDGTELNAYSDSDRNFLESVATMLADVIA